MPRTRYILVFPYFILNQVCVFSLAALHTLLTSVEETAGPVAVQAFIVTRDHVARVARHALGRVELYRPVHVVHAGHVQLSRGKKSETEKNEDSDQDRSGRGREKRGGWGVCMPYKKMFSNTSALSSIKFKGRYSYFESCVILRSRVVYFLRIY